MTEAKAGMPEQEHKELAIPPAQPNPPDAQGDEQVIRVPFHRLQKSATNPRKTRDTDADKGLAHSIKDNFARGGPGVLEPLLCRPVEAGNPNGNLEVVAGSRRLAAAKAADLDDVPCIIREMTDTEAQEVQIVENLQRQGVEPIEEARGLQFLNKSTSVEQIAKRIGKSPSYVYQALKLCELIPAAQKAMESQGLTAGHAILIARLTPDSQKEALESLYPKWNKNKDAPSVGVRELKEHIKNHATIPLKEATFDTENAELIKDVPACAKCPKLAANNVLFKDVPPANCTDRQCFADKTEAGIQAKITAAAAKKHPLYQIIEGDYTEKAPKPEETRLKAGQYRTAGKAHGVDYKICKSTKPAIETAGYRKGQLTQICIDRECRTHWPAATNIAGKSNKKAKRAAERIEARAIGLCINDAIKHATKLNRDDLFSIYILTTERASYRVRPEVFAEMKGPELDKIRPYLLTQKYTSTANEKDLARAIVAQLLMMSASGRHTPKKYKERAAAEIKAEANKAKAPKKKAAQPKRPARKSAKKAR